jgi:S-adenosylmethionine-diacylgycerolhomoserine-N-methlytransferase
MLDHARSKVPFASLVQGFAETANFQSVLGVPPDRIFYSYCLSMVAGAEDAISASRKALSPHGELVIVDFSESNTLPSLARRGLFEWLRTFHVRPLSERLLADASSVTYGPFHYYVIARFSRLEE